MAGLKDIIMRTENEMYDLMLGIAQNDVRIKAVYMNGSCNLLTEPELT